MGDVGRVVLEDRLSLSKAGIIVLLLPRDNQGFDLSEMKVVSRGFVFMKEADEVVRFIKEKTAEILEDVEPNLKDDEIKKKLERRLSRRLYKVIRREPMIVPVFLDK